jgi:predicted O-methyltransferase YrrM
MRWLRASKIPEVTAIAPERLPGQLDNSGLEAIVRSLVESWGDERRRFAIEVGTGGGRGSTVAMHRALKACGCPFQLVGYEGDAELAADASRFWRNTEDVQVINEYFMRSEDLDLAVKPRIQPADRASYLPEFAAVAAKNNFLETSPQGLIDLLFIDSVRYTHVAIVRAAVPWLQSETTIVMEDDIPDYGELAIVQSEFDLRDVIRHEIEGHPWPLVEFKLARVD